MDTLRIWISETKYFCLLIDIFYHILEIYCVLIPTTEHLFILHLFLYNVGSKQLRIHNTSRNSLSNKLPQYTLTYIQNPLFRKKLLAWTNHDVTKHEEPAKIFRVHNTFIKTLLMLNTLRTYRDSFQETVQRYYVCMLMWKCQTKVGTFAGLHISMRMIRGLKELWTRDIESGMGKSNARKKF